MNEQPKTKFAVKCDGIEPWTVAAHTAYDALKLAVNGHTRRAPVLQGDFEVSRDGCVSAAIWRTGRLYHLRPLKAETLKAENLKSENHDRQQQH